MLRSLLHAKIHRATVTHADLNYEGSITLDPNLMDAADFCEHQEVHIWNVTNGARFATYVLTGERGKGQVCINGAAAHHAKPGDLVIIASFVMLCDEERAAHRPHIIFVDENNRIRESGRAEIPGPGRAPNA